MSAPQNALRALHACCSTWHAVRGAAQPLLRSHATFRHSGGLRHLGTAIAAVRNDLAVDHGMLWATVVIDIAVQ